MRTKTKRAFTAASCFTLLALASTVVFADHRIDGTFDLTKYGFGIASEATVWIQKVEGEEGRYTVVREASHKARRGTGTLRSDGWLQVTFADVVGAGRRLEDVFNGASQGSETKGWYKVRENGNIYGYYQGPNADGELAWIFEYGKRGDERPMPDVTGADDAGTDEATTNETGASDTDEATTDETGTDEAGTDEAADSPELSAPKSGNCLVGQSLALTFAPADAEVEISGPAERDGDSIKITGEGQITLKAKSGDEESEAVTLTAITAKITEVTVLDTLDIADAAAPHFAKGLEAEDGETTPAAIFMGKKLRLQLKIQASEDLVETANVTLQGSDGVTFSKDVALKGLQSGQTVVVESDDVLNEGVAVNAINVDFDMGGADAGSAALRVYTTFKQPIKNIANDVNAPNTALHFEKACQWSRGASRNVGRGDDSIGYQIDNHMRHYVHWKDLNGFEPAVPDYPAGAGLPKNYDDLPASWNISGGERAVSSLYYPPLEPSEDYEKYENYRGNFGWWVLDNPDYTGGRCNQQAALVCGILGTVGIKAEILYLRRTARGKRTGRPIQNYFFTPGGGGPWNFHGIALATMEDGTQWIYDGSFSSPPNRKNGTREWAENEGGPFVGKFGPWYYVDWRGGKVPEDDIADPEDWVGIPLKTSGN